MKPKNPQNVTEEEAKASFFKQCRIYGGWRCSYCEQPGAQVQRQYTAYHEDISNWTCLCEECAKENYEMWKEQWREYYYMIR